MTNETTSGPTETPPQSQNRQALEKLGVQTAISLFDKEIPPMKWIAAGFLGEGVTLLSARPKAGKTLIALQLAIAVAKGEPFLGTYDTVKGPVLYVTVDDPSERRLQENLRQLGGRVDGLDFVSALAELDNGGIEKLDEMLTVKAQIEPYRLLILDTLTALRKEQKGKNVVKADYDFMAAVAKLGRKHNCATLILSHSRKDSNSANKVDAIDLHIGTTGLTAAVDAVMVMTGADASNKVLKAKGRDISPFELQLELQVSDRSGWRVVDAPAAPAKKTAELSPVRKTILKVVREIGPCGPDAVNKQVGGVAATVRSTLKRMADDEQLWRDTDGRYICSPPQLCNAETDATPATGATPATPATPATGATEESCLEKDRCGVAALHLLHTSDAVAPTTPDEPVLGDPLAAAPKTPTTAKKDDWILRAINGLGGSASSRQ